MKTLKRLIFGALSALLFAVGLVRAADRYDPIKATLIAVGEDNVSAAPDSSYPPDFPYDQDPG
jgi:hypothetical protein